MCVHLIVWIARPFIQKDSINGRFRDYIYRKKIPVDIESKDIKLLTAYIFAQFNVTVFPHLY